MKNEWISVDEYSKKVHKIIESEINLIPKLKDFASSHGDAKGYAMACGQEVLLERLIKKLLPLYHTTEKDSPMDL